LGLGVFGGVLAGLLGIGGGMILVPFMAMMFTAQGHPYATLMQVCLATSMATIVFTSMSSARAHNKAGNVRWDIVKGLVPGILLGVAIGTTVLSQMPTKWVKVFFSFFLMYSATKMLLTVNAVSDKTLPARNGLAGFGVVVGILSAMVGAGGGFMTVPFMTSRGVNARQAIGTSSALGFPIALFATIGYIVNGWSVPNLPSPHVGYVFIPALVMIAIASMIFAPLGAKLTQKLPVKSLKRIFAVMLYLLAGRMLWMTFAA
jgi:uncharacterized protein